MGHLRPIEAVDDKSGLPPTADELLLCGERRKGAINKLAVLD